MAGLDGRMESSLLGTRGDDPPRRAPAARLPLHGRRQLRHLDPVRLLVAGAAGMLGQDVMRAGSACGPRAARLSITASSTSRDGGAVAAAIERAAPDALINCAACTDVDGAESDREPGLRRQRRGRRPAGARGGRARPWRCCTSPATTCSTASPRAARRSGRGRIVESDRTAPLSVYGESKLAGEREVLDGRRAAPGRALGVAVRPRRAQLRRHDAARSRTSSAREGAPCAVEVVTDQVGSPTWTGPPGAGHDRAARAARERARAPRGRRAGVLERPRRRGLPPGRGRLRGQARRAPRRSAARRRGPPFSALESPSARTCCRCRRGRTGWPGIWRRALG